MIHIVKDTRLIEHVKEYDTILVGTSIKNVKGNGFQREVAINFYYAYEALNQTKYDDTTKLGTCLVVPNREDNPQIVYCFMTKGRYNPIDAVDYDALEKCLTLINKHSVGTKIAAPIIGESIFEGGGDRNKILSIFEKCCTDIDITLYDYEQKDLSLENIIKRKHIYEDYKNNVIDKGEYYERKKVFLWQQAFGIYTPVPDLPCKEVQKLIHEIKDERRSDE